MRFFSDNAAAVHPAVFEAMTKADRLDTAYDGDEWSRRLDSAFADLFGCEVAALWVTTGTAANCLALAGMVSPLGGILCHREAHIQVDEAGAPEFFTGGARLMLVDGPGAKLTVDALSDARGRIRADVHQVQPEALSITNATEYGRSYSAAETAALGSWAKQQGLAFHLDGARFANAAAFTGATPAELSWKAGVDALSFGFVKNGGLSAEALILFDPALAEGIKRRRKRSGHLLSKGRYLAAQLLALIENDIWLENGRKANEAARRLAQAAGDRLVHPVEANEVFLKVSAVEAAALRGVGFDFYDWGVGEARLVTSWDQDLAAVDKLAEAIAKL